MFEAKVYKIKVVSLSGIMEEVYVAKQTIQQWMSSIFACPSPSFVSLAGGRQKEIYKEYSGISREM